MILRHYQSLGIFPELIVAITLFAIVITMSVVLYQVRSMPPAVLVPNAIGSSELKPVQSDEAYARAFSDLFLSNWCTWNIYTYKARRQSAINLLWPGVQGTFSGKSSNIGGLVDSLGQSQVLSLSEVVVQPMNSQIWFVKATGELKIYYSGVGGKPEPYSAGLMLRKVSPTPASPMCLEVYGFKQSIGAEGADQESKKP